MPRDLPHHPFEIVRMFEENLEAYTGAPHAVVVESCTSAILLAVKYNLMHLKFCPPAVSIPRRTYVGVPQAIENAGATVWFRDEDWKGVYQIEPLEVWDCARRFTRNMYKKGQHQCVSFQTEKILALGRGGAILTDDATAASWYRSARCDGRHDGVTPADDQFQWGIHAYLEPAAAAEGIKRLFYLPDENADGSNDYPDLSQKEYFR